MDNTTQHNESSNVTDHRFETDGKSIPRKVKRTSELAQEIFQLCSRIIDIIDMEEDGSMLRDVGLIPSPIDQNR